MAILILRIGFAGEFSSQPRRNPGTDIEEKPSERSIPAAPYEFGARLVQGGLVKGSPKA
jgi:hypothetical protein